MKPNFFTSFLGGMVSSFILALLFLAFDPDTFKQLDQFMVLVGVIMMVLALLMGFAGLILLFTPQRKFGGWLLLTGLVMVLIGFGTCASFFTLSGFH
ncbi:MAG: hypothetical protein MUC97_12270 [Bernardetiaceae bacterium]|jgi:hypothetical protein|nr:hypothetical protein [Bernardetiaceae bacterium]